LYRRDRRINNDIQCFNEIKQNLERHLLFLEKQKLNKVNTKAER